MSIVLSAAGALLVLTIVGVLLVIRQRNMRFPPSVREMEEARQRDKEQTGHQSEQQQPTQASPHIQVMSADEDEGSDDPIVTTPNGSPTGGPPSSKPVAKHGSEHSAQTSPGNSSIKPSAKPARF